MHTTFRQAGRQAARRTDGRAGGQLGRRATRTGGQTVNRAGRRRTGGRTVNRAGGQPGGQATGWAGNQAGRQPGRWATRWAGNQAGGQPGRRATRRAGNLATVKIGFAITIQLNPTELLCSVQCGYNGSNTQTVLSLSRLVYWLIVIYNHGVNKALAKCCSTAMWYIECNRVNIDNLGDKKTCCPQIEVF